MQAFVSDGLKTGKTKDQIVASLVAKYGEVIRGAPKAEGFNLVVWIAPFAATLLGFVIAAWILLRWVRRRAPATASGPAPARRVGRRYRDPGSRFPAGARRVRAETPARVSHRALSSILPPETTR